MTRVWKTLRGGRFHREATCPGIADGHAKAALGGMANHPPALVDLVDIESEISPCSRCWGQAFREDDWLSTRLETEAKADSSYEVDFLESVLRRVRPAIDPDYVRVQYPAPGASGT
jgi:hypothetical protein